MKVYFQIGLLNKFINSRWILFKTQISLSLDSVKQYRHERHSRNY